MAEETPKDADAPEETPETVEETPETVEETPGDGLPANTVTIEDSGEAKKKVTIEVDRKRIQAKFDEIFGELRTSAQVPGFRVGHAPRRLMEKRFGKEASSDVRNGLISESLAAAIEEKELNILGEPDIKLDEIELPEEGNFVFDVVVEVVPEFSIPDYKAIPVTEPPTEATPERTAEATKRILANRGSMSPTDEPAETQDLVVVDVKVTGEGIDETRENAEYRVGPAAIEGVPLETLGDELTGKTVGDTVSLEATAPDTHPNEDWQGKAVTVELTVKEVKRLEIPELTDELAAEFGLENAEQFNELVKQNLETQMQEEKHRSMREQVRKYLLDNTELELPEGATARHTANLLRRRYIELMQMGVPRDSIDQNLEMLETQAGERAKTELKLSFILSEVAEAEEVAVDEGEVNSRIAQMAASYGRRPERLRSEMESQGTLDEVETTIREQKAIDKLLETAIITPAADAPAKSADEDTKKPKKKAAKKQASDEKADAADDKE